MKPCYTFDSARYFLGTKCKHGHTFPGTDKALRVPTPVPVSKKGYGPYLSSNCVACAMGSFRGAPWYWRFLDCDASGLPAGSKLGKLCSGHHEYHCTGLTLRGKDGKCCECEKVRRQSESYKSASRHRYASNELSREKQKLASRVRNKERYASMTPEQHQARVEYKRQVRERLRQQGLTASGKRPVNATALVPKAELMQMAQERRGQQRAAVEARRQEREARREACRLERESPDWLEKRNARLREKYASDENLRLYNREKSKRRKATIKERHAVRVRSRDIRARFAQFDGCAYCGTHGDMHMDHFIPLAHGGTHALGNLVPACAACNYSKRDHDAETWYRAQPFFTEKRWRKILQVLGIKRGSPLQLALL